MCDIPHPETRGAHALIQCAVHWLFPVYDLHIERVHTQTRARARAHTHMRGGR